MDKDKDDSLLREALLPSPDVVAKKRRVPLGAPTNVIKAPDPRRSELISLNDAPDRLENSPEQIPWKLVKEDPIKMNASIQFGSSNSIDKPNEGQTPMTTAGERVERSKIHQSLMLEKRIPIWDAPNIDQANNDFPDGPSTITFASEGPLLASDTESVSSSEHGGENYTHNQKPTVDVPRPPTLVTDSGYESMFYVQIANKEYEHDDSQTILTDNQ